MKKLSKVLVVLLMVMGLVFMTSCEDIKKAKVQAVETSLNFAFSKFGVEGFELPECEDVKIKMNNDLDQDYLSLDLEVVSPDCTLEEYQEQIKGYIVEAVMVNGGEGNVSYEELSDYFEPEEIENGYKWSLEQFIEEIEGETLTENLNFEILIVEENGSYKLSVELQGIIEFINAVAELEDEQAPLE